MGRIFISHYHDDNIIAKKICDALEEDGLRCWIAPRDILPGEDWAPAIMRGLSECDTMILVYTAGSNASRQVLHEVNTADTNGMKIMLLRLSGMELNPGLKYYLSTAHWYNAVDADFDSILPDLKVYCRKLATSKDDWAQGDVHVTAAGYGDMDIDMLRSRVSHGDMKAAYELADRYISGNGVMENKGEFIRLLRLAADGGNADAQRRLGYCFEIGKGVEKNIYEAVRYYRLAADQNHPTAMCDLAILYENGKGVEENIDEAVRLYKLAADQGNAAALNNLGLCYVISWTPYAGCWPWTAPRATPRPPRSTYLTC